MKTTRARTILAAVFVGALAFATTQTLVADDAAAAAPS